MIPMAWRCGPAVVSGCGAPWSIRRVCASTPFSTLIRVALACSSVTATLTITRTIGCSMTADRACGSNPSPVGAKAPFNSWRFRRSMKPLTISWPSGIRQTRRSPVRSCSSATACTGAQMPVRPPLAEVVATRTGLGGYVGQKRTHFSWRFVVDFVGGDLSMLGKDVEVEPVITASRGQIEVPSVRRLDIVQGYRVTFDLKPTDDSVAPVNLRLYLRADGQPLTETWLYQWTPAGL